MDDQVPSSLSGPPEELKGADPAWLKKLEQDGLTEDQVAAIQRHFQENFAAPLQPSIRCADQDCQYFTSCPLVRAKIPRPLGSPCPIEEASRENWFKLYAGEIGEATDGYTTIDMGAACDLVNTLMQMQRIQWEMADMPNVVERVIQGHDKDGNPIVQLKMNPLQFAHKSAMQVKLKVQESLILTREARAKDKSRATQDMAQLMSQVRAVAERVNQIPDRRNEDGTPISIAERLAQLPEIKKSS
jgi:hypothetical protein